MLVCSGQRPPGPISLPPAVFRRVATAFGNVAETIPTVKDKVDPCFSLGVPDQGAPTTTSGIAGPIFHIWTIAHSRDFAHHLRPIHRQADVPSIMSPHASVRVKQVQQVPLRMSPTTPLDVHPRPPAHAMKGVLCTTHRPRHCTWRRLPSLPTTVGSRTPAPPSPTTLTHHDKRTRAIAAVKRARPSVKDQTRLTNVLSMMGFLSRQSPPLCRLPVPRRLRCI